MYKSCTCYKLFGSHCCLLLWTYAASSFPISISFTDLITGQNTVALRLTGEGGLVINRNITITVTEGMLVCCAYTDTQYYLHDF